MGDCLDMAKLIMSVETNIQECLKMEREVGKEKW